MNVSNKLIKNYGQKVVNEKFCGLKVIKKFMGIKTKSLYIYKDQKHI